MKAKEIIRQTVAGLMQAVERLLIKLNIIRPKIIIWIDGGICSQIFQWLKGQYYAEKGYDVYYDTIWFVKYGYNLDGTIAYYFELQEMCPDVKVPQLSAFRNNFYRLFFRVTEYENNMLPDRETIRQSMYISRYPNIPDKKWLEDNVYKFFGIDKIKTVPESLLPIVDGKMTCAVHVRRGDLAKRNIAGFYTMTPTQYFFDTIDYVAKKYKNVCFCFFSDELDFIETDILPSLTLPNTCDYVLMQGNKAYEDLVLVARCDMIIGSQGSASRYGAMMNPKSGLILPKINDEVVVGYDVIRDMQ